ncbi:major facilitator superfamily protein [Paraburkholderia hospita]|jgi:MFS family permease|uniref:Major facilitator superfamily protein n=1 Tax=Paraburkholderia hospita TaxID=169430 RepID=A0ABN0FVA9_9BURK|nr:MFS transporter [Paraburkholderia hospita]EIN02759.1 major facilitator superfamily protein [Paraburkholderia hospita]OUL80528.1 MFS transporter [Paraburkholderia hospita]OUL89622.1 MFS transporter [Paraburkholderia hospita]SKC76611.1 Major Facilitator Superfamily protein [Burkholderia sp. CF099]
MADKKTRAMLRRVAAASTIGTAAEYYDFFVYGTAAVLVFGAKFFPSSDPLIGTLAAFATYAVGFVARPLGGIVFGHFGDRIGRKKALIVTILIVGLGTFAIGLLPDYSQIGVWAPASLILIRVLQGFGVGGEQAGAVLLTAEYAPPRERGFFASLVQLGAPAGFLIPSGLFALLSATLTHEQLMDWGWRLPFLGSIVLVVVGLYIRLRTEESPIFASIRETKAVESRPVVEVVKQFGPTIVKGVGAKLIEACTFAMYTMIVLAYGRAHGISESLLLQTIIVAVVLELLAIPLAGALSDRIGRRTTFITGAVLQVLLVVPLFHAVDSGNRLAIQAAMILAISVGHSLCYAPQASLFPELFPARVRCSGIALIWQIGSLIGSGVLGLVAVKLIQATHGNSIGLVIYVALLGIVSAVCIFLLPETAPARRGGDLHDWGAPQREPALHEAHASAAFAARQ